MRRLNVVVATVALFPAHLPCSRSECVADDVYKIDEPYSACLRVALGHGEDPRFAVVHEKFKTPAPTTVTPTELPTAVPTAVPTAALGRPLEIVECDETSTVQWMTPSFAVEGSQPVTLINVPDIPDPGSETAQIDNGTEDGSEAAAEIGVAIRAENLTLYCAEIGVDCILLDKIATKTEGPWEREYAFFVSAVDGDDDKADEAGDEEEEEEIKLYNIQSHPDETVVPITRPGYQAGPGYCVTVNAASSTLVLAICSPARRATQAWQLVPNSTSLFKSSGLPPLENLCVVPGEPRKVAIVPATAPPVAPITETEVSNLSDSNASLLNGSNASTPNGSNISSEENSTASSDKNSNTSSEKNSTASSDKNSNTSSEENSNTSLGKSIRRRNFKTEDQIDENEVCGCVSGLLRDLGAAGCCHSAAAIVMEADIDYAVYTTEGMVETYRIKEERPKFCFAGRCIAATGCDTTCVNAVDIGAASSVDQGWRWIGLGLHAALLFI